MRTSQAIASSQPPPNASPLTAAIVIDARPLPARAAARARASSSSRPPASSIFVNALMSAPAQNSVGFGEAMTSACTAASPSTGSQTFCERLDHVRARSSWPAGCRATRSRSSPRVSSLTGARLVARVGLRVGVEALAGLRAEAALGDQPAQDQRRLEVLAPLVLGPLERGQHVVEPAESARANGPGIMPGADHHRRGRCRGRRRRPPRARGRPRRTPSARSGRRAPRRSIGAASGVLIEALPALRRRGCPARRAPPCPGGRRSGRRRTRAGRWATFSDRVEARACR